MIDKISHLIFGRMKQMILGEMERLLNRLQHALLTQIEDMQAEQYKMSSQVDSVIRGLAMTINQQNQILQRLDDIEADIQDINKEINIDE